MSKAVLINHISKKFSLHDKRISILRQLCQKGPRARFDEFSAADDVTFDASKSSILNIIGANGSGESTLLTGKGRALPIW